MAQNDAPGPLTLLAMLIMAVFSLIGAVFNLGAAARAKAQAASEARASEERQRRWLEHVRREMARGRAGNASEQDALAALRGRGGRPNPLDGRRYR